MYQYISNKLDMIEYYGNKQPLYFDHILPNSVIPQGLSATVDTVSDTGTDIVSSTKVSGSNISVTANNHGLMNNSTIIISDHSTAIINTKWKIRVVDSNTFLLLETALIENFVDGNGGQFFTVSTVTHNLSEGDVAWIENVGAYMVRGEDWDFLDNTTKIINHGDKIYTTDKNGNYLVSTLSPTVDNFNQIKFLEHKKGYILLSNKVPYTLSYNNNIFFNESKNPKISFDKYRCFSDRLITEIVDEKDRKYVHIAGMGFCDIERGSAHGKIYLNVVNLEALNEGLDTYTIKLSCDQKNVVFKTQELYIDNNSDPTQSIDIEFINDDFSIETNVDTNTIIKRYTDTFNIKAELYLFESLIDSDELVVHVVCNDKPQEYAPSTPQPIKATFNVVH